MAVYRFEAGERSSVKSENQVFFYDHAPPMVDYSREVLEGLLSPAKYISPKFFYDEYGSELFTEITHQPEYYLTVTETQLLRSHAEQISALIGDEIVLIEYGSGSSTKIRILLENLRPAIYAPLDISKDYLMQASRMLAEEYPWLEVHASCVDFTTRLDLPFHSDKRRVGFFPGSSIGNFEPAQASSFLAQVRELVGDDGALLLGVDLVKDVDILNSAYNDAAGVTRLFNLNVLRHLNEVYGTNFVLSRFEHQAFFDADQGCIQMYLVSEVDQVVDVGGQSISIRAGERIHTENSYKYTVDQIKLMAASAGFRGAHVWVDTAELFGLFYLSA